MERHFAYIPTDKGGGMIGGQRAAGSGQRQSAALALFLLLAASLLLLAGCSNSGPATTDGPTASANQHIWRGHDDDGSPDSNAVVYVQTGVDPKTGKAEGCTGTLITSRLVLTANHCFAGETSFGQNGGPHPVAGAYIFIGPDSQNWVQLRPIYKVVSRIGGAPTADITQDRDVALLVVAPPRTVAAEDFAYPSKLALTTTGWPDDERIGYSAEYVGWGQTETGHGPRFRQYQNYPGGANLLYLNHVPGPGPGAIWYANWQDLYYGCDHGDSGGPLYMYLNVNGQSVPYQVGVFSFMTPQDNNGQSAWVDSTAATIQDWLHSTDGGEDPDHPGKLIGQTDYTGPCQKSVDQDCDRFYDSDDNCPTVFNPLQYPGHDSDGDGVPDYCDNCIDTPNPDQADSDGDGFGDKCDVCPEKTPSTSCKTNKDCGKNVRCVTYLDWADQNPAHYDPTTGAATQHVSRCAGDKDTDGDGVGDLCDNCPSVANDQSDCNLDAEEDLGILPLLGDACDPVPCAKATLSRNGFVNKFNSSCSDPLAAKDCGYGANIEIDWHGVQQKDVTPVTQVAATGVTEFAHCDCAGPSDVGARIAGCKHTQSGARRCSIAHAGDFPPNNGKSSTSAWDAMTTQSMDPNCKSTGSCAPASHQLITSAYERSNSLWDNREVIWRPDFDLHFLPLALQLVKSEQQFVAVAPNFDGLSWAHTPHFNGQDLNTIALPTATARPATYSDDASHYFVQDLKAGPRINIPSVACPPGAPCGGFSAFTDLVCPSCPVHRLSDWLWLGNSVVELNPRLSEDVTNKVDPTLLEMLGDSGLTVVPVSEATSLLHATDNSLRAIAVNNTALTSPGVVADTPTGVAGLLNAPTIANGIDPPHVFAASATQELAYAVGNNGGTETLTTIPVGGGPSKTLPLTGVDADGHPESLAYRFQDRSVYLADLEHHGWWSWLRILRIEPGTGAATVIAWRPISDALDAAYLSVDDAGQLVLATGVGHTTFFTTFYVGRHHLRTTGWLQEEGTLLAPPDTRGETGYSVVMRRPRTTTVQALEIPASALGHFGPTREHPGHGPPEPHGRGGYGAHDPGPPQWH